LWTECVSDMSKEYAGLVSRWSKCGFDPADVVGFGTKVSLRLATDPWKFLDLVLKSSTSTSGSHQHGSHARKRDL
jgi:hypothetical protein